MTSEISTCAKKNWLASNCPADCLVTAKCIRKIKEAEENTQLQGLDTIEKVARALAVYEVPVGRLIQVLVELLDRGLGTGTNV